MAPVVFGPADASCEVLTFKEGVLSPVAHDLLLRVTAFEIAIEPSPIAVAARFDARSLRVVSAMRAGRPAPALLSQRDKAEIEESIRSAVLQAPRHPEITFASREVSRRDGGWSVRGVLTLAGISRERSLEIRQDRGRLTGEARLHQPDFGIKPYRAMLGALRVQAEVIVRVSTPALAPSAGLGEP